MMGKDGSNKKTRLLIGSNGGLTGIYLAKNLRGLDDLILYGADSSDISAGKFFVDRQIHLPDAQDRGFIGGLIDVLEREKIDIYLPTHSREIRAVASNEARIRRSTKARFIVSPDGTFRALDDKVAANTNLRQIGIPVPRLITDVDTVYPIFMKDRVGSGSRGAIVIENALVHKAYMDTCDGVSFFQMIRGREYTADCLFDQSGYLLGYNQRQRIKTIGGAVSITKDDHKFDISPWLKKISDTWVFRGCVNFQYIVQDGIPYFIDVNLRYPSGGLPLTVRSGLDIPKLTVSLLLGGQPAPEIRISKKTEKIMYRYYEEIFEECDFLT